MPQDVYRYYCNTESQFIKELVEVGDPAPTVCKNDAGHTITLSSLTIVRMAPRKADVGLSNVVDIKNNLTATVDPAVTDDTAAGYSLGSKWINITTIKEFICTNASAGAAVWSSAGGGGSTLNLIFIGDATYPYLATNSTTYITLGSFVYKSSLQLTKFEIVVLRYLVSGYVRIYDTTNSLQICEKRITNTSKAIVDMGTLSNMPTSDALFEIQAKDDTTSGYIILYSLCGS